MTDLPILRDLGIILLAALAFTLAARLVKMPTIVAYILAGLALGPGSRLLEVTPSVELISHVGIALLLFLVGLELSLDKIKDVGRVAVLGGVGQVVITVALAGGLSLALGFSLVEAAFLGLAVSFSSTVVVVKLLDQRKEMHATHGRIAVGVLLVQDLIVIIALTFLMGLGIERDVSVAALLEGLAVSFGGMLALLAVALLAARYVLPPIFSWISESQDALLIWSLCWCFLMVVGAELFHLSEEIGAFLAGFSLAQLPFNHELRRRVHPLMNFFVAVFFVSLGVRMELGSALDHWVPALVLSAFVLVLKPAIFMAIVPRAGYRERNSFLSSLSLGQISEFSFILAALALTTGIIDEAVLALIGLIGLVTIAASSFLILRMDLVYERLSGGPILRAFRASPERRSSPEREEEESGHVIVVGMNSLGRRVVDALLQRGQRVVAVDSSPRNLAGLSCRTVVGNADHLSVLEEAGLASAKLLVSALQIEDTNNLLAFRARAAGVSASIHAFDESVITELREIGVDHLIISKSAGIRKVARALREEGILQ